MSDHHEYVVKENTMHRLKTDLVVTSPGRINLIGEHTDYNDGFVLPAAIDKAIILKLGKNGTKSDCRIHSQGFGDIVHIDLASISKSNNDWENYILGVLHELMLLTDKLRGFDCTIESHLPIGSGVSSSAALECGLAFGLNKLFDLGLRKWDIIQLSQRAEHNFVGTKCGIMDQFASVMGKDKHVMLLDCKTLDFEYIPINIEPYRILLLNTNVRHNLAFGEYNVRREQCYNGLAIVGKQFQIGGTFRNVTMDMLNACRSEMGDVVYNRCSYVIQENERVLEAVQALRDRKMDRFGELLYQTHTGLSEQFEVSCPELDFLVNFSKEWKEVLGARMMGGGFGGCTLNIVHKDAAEDFIEEASKVYKKKFSLELSAFQTLLSKGTSIMEKNG
ncbi:MAG: galactokinase [Bacteroidota bacterium]|nr:galactokinase [Bacteroidota bacterium]